MQWNIKEISDKGSSEKLNELKQETKNYKPAIDKNNFTSIYLENFKGFAPKDNKEENVIIFYYTADTENAYYVITHWVQNIDGNGYSEYRSIQAPGKIGSTISEDPLTITGFTYNSTKSKASGEIKANGLELNLYYDRNTYPLTVQYLEYKTNNH